MTSSDQAPDPRLDTVVRIGMATGTISVIGSVMLIIVLLRSPKKLTSVYRRLVFSLSCMDIVHSLTYVAGGMPVPKENAGIWYSTYAIGNTIACDIQGFMNFTGLMGSVFYSCALSVYFTLVIVYSKNEDAIQKSIEPFCHAISILIPLGLGIFLMATDNFNGAAVRCWIAPYPIDCLHDKNIKCTRGEHAIWYRFYLQFVPIAFAIIIFFACMIRLIYSIRSQYKKMTKYGSNEILANIKKKRQSIQSTSTINATIKHRSSMVKPKQSKKSQKEMKQTSIQAILYISAMILLTFPGVIRKFFLTAKNGFMIMVLMNFFLPLAGLYNFLIFIRPRVVMTMEAKPDVSLLKAFIVAIISKEIKPQQQKRSARASVRSTTASTSIARARRVSNITRRSLLGSPSTVDAKIAAKLIQDEEEENEKGEEEKEEEKENDEENEESKEEIVAYQRSLHGRENNTPPTTSNINQKSNEGEEGDNNDNNNHYYHDANEESKEEIVAYKRSLCERESNTSPINIGLNQICNEREKEEKEQKDSHKNNYDENESKEKNLSYQSSLFARDDDTPSTNIGLNQMSNDIEKNEQKDVTDNYDYEENEESKEEIIAYQSSLYVGDDNTPLINIGLNQMSNDTSFSDSVEEADGENLDLTNDYNNML